MNLSASYGVQPFVFRGEWHFFKFPFLMFGSIPIWNFWEDRPSDDVLNSLTHDEQALIGTRGQLGLDAFFTINRAFYSSSARPLDEALMFKLVMARTDLYTTIALLKFLPDDLWNAMYHLHQSAEKGLKTFLSARGAADKQLRKQHGHDLVSLLDQCASLDGRFASRRALLPHLAWSNDWRYTPYNFEKERVANMFDCAMILLADVVDALVPGGSTWPSRVHILGEERSTAEPPTS